MSISPTYLTSDQLTIVEQPIPQLIFLEGLAGTGKTTVGFERVINLLANGIPGNHILILSPQRTLAMPYYDGPIYMKKVQNNWQYMYGFIM